MLLGHPVSCHYLQSPSARWRRGIKNHKADTLTPNLSSPHESRPRAIAVFPFSWVSDVSKGAALKNNQVHHLVYYEDTYSTTPLQPTSSLQECPLTGDTGRKRTCIRRSWRVRVPRVVRTTGLHPNVPGPHSNLGESDWHFSLSHSLVNTAEITLIFPSPQKHPLRLLWCPSTLPTPGTWQPLMDVLTLQICLL